MEFINSAYFSGVFSFRNTMTVSLMHLLICVPHSLSPVCADLIDHIAVSCIERIIFWFSLQVILRHFKVSSFGQSSLPGLLSGSLYPISVKPEGEYRADES